MAEKYKIGVIGTGQRGADYMRLLKDHPGVEAAALCDTSPERLKDFAHTMGCDEIPCFTSLDELFEKSCVEGVIITTPDFTHAECAVAALKNGKDVLLEKPMAPTAPECREILKAQRESGKVLQIGFELRCHPLFRRIKEVVQSGMIGQLLSMNFSESLKVMHGASYMRRWHRKSSNSGGFLLAKCSHDLDLMSIIAGAPLVRTASFGSLNFFTPDKMKARFCSQCDEKDCRFRFNGEMVRMTAEDEKAPSLKQFDLCVFNDDKDVVDNQQVLLEYANGVRGTFSLNLFAPKGCRRWFLVGTLGHIAADTESNTMTILFSDGRETVTETCVSDNSSSHQGSDLLFLNEFLDCVRNGAAPAVDPVDGLVSTVVGNAIEKARLSGEVVHIAPEEYSF